MKKFIMCLTAMVIIAGLGKIAQAESYWYTNTISTKSASDGPVVAPSISYASLKLQQLSIYHVTASTCAYEVYTSASATGTKTLRYTLYLPATVGIYYFPSAQILNSSASTGSDLISAPFIYIRNANNGAEAWCATDRVGVIYKR